MTLTLSSLLSTVSSTITDVIPDFSVYVAAAVVFSLAAYTVRRFLSAGL